MEGTLNSAQHTVHGLTLSAVIITATVTLALAPVALFSSLFHISIRWVSLVIYKGCLQSPRRAPVSQWGLLWQLGGTGMFFFFLWLLPRSQCRCPALPPFLQGCFSSNFFFRALRKASECCESHRSAFSGRRPLWGVWIRQWRRREHLLRAGPENRVVQKTEGDTHSAWSVAGRRTIHT